MELHHISYETKEHAAVVTIDRPDVLNALNRRSFTELLWAFDRADEDDAVRAVIVTGAGRAFCAGADLSRGAETFDGTAGDAGRTQPGGDGRAPRDPGGLLALRIFNSAKPVIAAINGAAVGVGLTMTLPMDFRLVAEGAKLGFVFAARGIAPDAASSWFLPRVVGISQALDWVLTGRTFRPDEALAAGLVQRVVPVDDLLPAAYEIAAMIAANVAPVSAVVSRNLLWQMLAEPHPIAAHRADSDAIFDLGAKADAREGVTAFLERRPARWTLRPSVDLPDKYPYWTGRDY